MALTAVRRSFRVRSAFMRAGGAFILTLFAFSAAALASDPKPLTFARPSAHNQPVLIDVTDDIKADVHVAGWNRPNVDITVYPTGHYADSVRLSGSVENGTLAMHLLASPSPHKGLFGWLSFYRPDARIEMHVPNDATLSVHVINGAIAVENVTGKLRVTLVNGPITVTGAGTVLYLTTTNGPVSADIAKITAQPNIIISTTNGPVDVVVPSGFKASVHASTVLGPVQNDLRGADGPGTVSLESVNGPVTIRSRRPE